MSAFTCGSRSPESPLFEQEVITAVASEKKRGLPIFDVLRRDDPTSVLLGIGAGPRRLRPAGPDGHLRPHLPTLPTTADVVQITQLFGGMGGCADSINVKRRRNEDGVDGVINIQLTRGIPSSLDGEFKARCARARLYFPPQFS